MRTVDYLLQQDEKRNKSDVKQAQQTPTPTPGRQGEGIYDPSNHKYPGPAPVPASGYKPAQTQNDQEIADGMPQARKIGSTELQHYAMPGEHQQNTVSYRNAQQAPAPSKPATPYQHLVRILYPEQEERRYEDEQRKLDKKRKRDAAISAVGDGLAALSNLATASRGAQNIDVASNTMSAKSKERYDKLQADRDARRDAYRNAMLNAAMRDRAEQIEQERTERAEQLSAANAAEQTRQFDETMRYNRERDRLNADTRVSTASISAEARKYAAERAAFARKYAADHKKNGGGGGKQGHYPLVKKDGSIVYLHNQTEWEYEYGREYPDEPLYDNSSISGSSTNAWGEKTETERTSRNRSAANAAGARAAQRSNSSNSSNSAPKSNVKKGSASGSRMPD